MQHVAVFLHKIQQFWIRFWFHLRKDKITFNIFPGITTLYIIIRVHSAFSLVVSCVLLKYTRGWRQLMAWSNLANLFCGSSHDFCQLYYNIKQIDFIFLCFCTVIAHRWCHSVWRTKSHGTRLRLVHTFLFFTRHDVICDLLQYGRTQKWNLFVEKYT